MRQPGLPLTGDEKHDETIAFRLPEATAAWVRDRARMSNMTVSALVCMVISQWLQMPEGLRKPLLSKPDVRKLESARDVLDTLLRESGA